MKKSTIFIPPSLFALLLISPLLLTSCSHQSPATQPVTQPMDTTYNQQLNIKDQILNVQIVTTAEDMAQGLSDRGSMEPNQGMLFNFGSGKNNMPGFWMNRMKFNLDLIWIKNKKIISITSDVPAPQSTNDQLPMYYPPSPIDEVLEVNAGWSEEHGVGVGDMVEVMTSK